MEFLKYVAGFLLMVCAILFVTEHANADTNLGTCYTDSAVDKIQADAYQMGVRNGYSEGQVDAVDRIRDIITQACAHNPDWKLFMGDNEEGLYLTCNYTESKTIPATE